MKIQLSSLNTVVVQRLRPLLVFSLTLTRNFSLLGPKHKTDPSALNMDFPSSEDLAVHLKCERRRSQDEREGLKTLM